jgi:hypothetical protein
MTTLHNQAMEIVKRHKHTFKWSTFIACAIVVFFMDIGILLEMILPYNESHILTTLAFWGYGQIVLFFFFFLGLCADFFAHSWNNSHLDITPIEVKDDTFLIHQNDTPQSISFSSVQKIKGEASYTFAFKKPYSRMQSYGTLVLETGPKKKIKINNIEDINNVTNELNELLLNWRAHQ